jgi:hypothetical protein
LGPVAPGLPERVPASNNGKTCVTDSAGMRITVVCSDEARNGKTLTARLMSDHMLLTGRDPHIFDCDHPGGRIRHFFPERTTHIDIERTDGQMRMFDAMLADPSRDYVVDLQKSGFEPFFTVLEDLDFINAAHDQGLELAVAFLLDRKMTSLVTARDLHGAFPDVHFSLIHNAWSCNLLTTPQSRDIYEEIEPDVEFTLPVLDPEAMAVADEPPFSFSRCVTENYAGLVPRVRLRLRAFLNDVFGQFRTRDLRLDLVTLREQGLI